MLASHPLEVLCELSSELGHADLVAAVDSVIAPGFIVPGITVEQILAHVRGRPTLRHRAKLLAAGRRRSSGCGITGRDVHAAHRGRGRIS